MRATLSSAHCYWVALYSLQTLLSQRFLPNTKVQKQHFNTLLVLLRFSTLALPPNLFMFVLIVLLYVFIYFRIFNGKLSVKIPSIDLSTVVSVCYSVVGNAVENINNNKKKRKTHLPLIDLANNNKFANFEHFFVS